MAIDYPSRKVGTMLVPCCNTTAAQKEDIFRPFPLCSSALPSTLPFQFSQWFLVKNSVTGCGSADIYNQLKRVKRAGRKFHYVRQFPATTGDWLKGKWNRFGLVGLVFWLPLWVRGCGACEMLFVAIKYAKVVTHTHAEPSLFRCMLRHNIT